MPKAISRHRNLILLILLQLIILSFVFKPDHFLWWDECTHMLLAKSVVRNPLAFETGVIGLYIESFRPHLLPWFLALLGADPYAGLFLMLGFSLLATALFYKLIQAEIGEEAAFLASLILITSLSFLQYSVRIYNDVPSLPIAFAALLLAKEKNAKWAGIMFGLSLMMRYTNVLFFFPVAYLLLKDENRRKALTRFLLWSLVVFSIQLVVSDTLVYGIPFASLPHQLIIFSESPKVPQILYYMEMLFAENPILLAFSIAGAAFAFAERRYMILIWLAATMLLELPMVHKEPRYVLTFVPIFAILAALCIVRLGEKINEITKLKKARLVLYAIVALIVLIKVPGHLKAINDTYGGDSLLIKTFPIVEGKTILTNWHIEYKCHANATVYSLWFKEDLEAAKNLDYVVIFTSEYGEPDSSARYYKLLGDDFVLVQNLTEPGYKFGRAEIFARK